MTTFLNINVICFLKLYVYTLQPSLGGVVTEVFLTNILINSGFYAVTTAWSPFIGAILARDFWTFLRSGEVPFQGCLQSLKA